jgi:hypothetical protein
MNHHPHIPNAACNLLGICFIIIGSLKLADLNSRSYGDETAWAAGSDADGGHQGNQPHNERIVCDEKRPLFLIVASNS